MHVEGLILFPGNPWPLGHPIRVLDWWARLDNDALYFHLHLESERYDKHASSSEHPQLAGVMRLLDLMGIRTERSPSEAGENRLAENRLAENASSADDRIADVHTDADFAYWSDAAVWRGAERCTLSSRLRNGLRVADCEHPLDLDELRERVLRTDSYFGDEVPTGFVPSFDLDLLGEDTAIQHRFEFAPRHSRSSFGLRWEAQLALTHKGSRRLDHSLIVTADLVRFLGVEAPRDELERVRSMLVRPGDWDYDGQFLRPDR